MSRGARVLVVGAGGLGAPVLRGLAQSRATSVTIVDDDVVELSNLHRQTLFTDADVGRSKLACAEEALRQLAPDLEVRLIEGRFVPDNAMGLLEGHDIVVEGADNLPTKFLVTDASRLAGVPAVQAGSVRWNGWAFCALSDSACLRCLFEDIPRDRVETCAEAGVVGPVVGVLGGVQAALVSRLLDGERPGGELWHYQALGGGLRQTHVARRHDCPLCAGNIQDIRMERYVPACAA
ncbi:MAG: HesA/MoeB/ThiF family protein [Myxococcota bacterium]